MAAIPSRVDRLVPWVAGLMIAAPVLAVRLPPMMDLPLHEAVVGLLRHWGDAAYVPPNVYALNLGQPNQAFYFVILALSYALSIPTATKVVVAATLVFLPVAAARLADHVGVTRWTSLVVAPVGLGWLFFYGLLANVIGLGLYLFALPTLDDFVDRPSARGSAAVSGWLVLLHFVHDLMALSAGFTVLVLSACAWRPAPRRNVARIAPAAFVAAMALVSRALEAQIVRSGGREVVAFAPLGFRVTAFADALFAGTGWVSLGLLATASVPLALFVADRARRHTNAETGERFGWRFRFEILGGAFLVLYFVAPVSVEWTKSSWAGVGGQIHMRFLPLAWSLLAVSAAPRGAGEGSVLAKALACLAPIAPLLVTWPEFAASDRVYRDLDRIAEHVAPGSSHAVLELGPIEPGALFSAATAGGHLVAKLGGRSLFDYSRSPASPVVQRPEAQWVEAYDRIDPHPFRLVPPHDLGRFRYVVLHSSEAGRLEIAAMAMAPEARVVANEGDFILLESTLPRVPIDAPDDPFPPPRPPNLGDRIEALAARLGDPAR
jgi:hypothetical protein